MARGIMVQRVGVQITDRQRTRAWYEEVLGAGPRQRGPDATTMLTHKRVEPAIHSAAHLLDPIFRTPEPPSGLGVHSGYGRTVACNLPHGTWRGVMPHARSR